MLKKKLNNLKEFMTYTYRRYVRYERYGRQFFSRYIIRGIIVPAGCPIEDLYLRAVITLS